MRKADSRDMRYRENSRLSLLLPIFQGEGVKKVLILGGNMISIQRFGMTLSIVYQIELWLSEGCDNL